MHNNLAIILTARMNSERLPGKAMATIKGQPLIYWLVRRLATIGRVVLATTKESSDDNLAAFVEAMGFPVYRGSTNDVVERMDNALHFAYPDAEFVLRGLGDCPFMAGELIERACDIMAREQGDAFVWALPPHVLPVYGAREFPYSRAAWTKIVNNAVHQEREHVDMYFHRHRDHFKIIYHEPPGSVYFRDYRLEIDWPEDLQMVQAVAAHLPITARLPEIIKYLDSAPVIARLNHDRVERTGPTLTSQEERRKYYEWMRGKPIIGWDDLVWKMPSDHAEPIFCNSGQCLLGYGDKGTLYRPNGDQINGDALIQCQCGVGKRWRNKG